MGVITILPDVREPTVMESHVHDGSLMSFLEERWPDGFQGQCVSVMVDGQRCSIEDFDKDVSDSSTVIAFSPAGFSLLVGFLVAAVVAVSIATALLFSGLSGFDSDAEKAGSVYSVGVQANEARLGQSIPVTYGRVTRTPEYASQSYRVYESNNEVRHFILCLGMGECKVESVRIGDTNERDLPDGIVSWREFRPSSHGERVGGIQRVTGVHENVVTSGEVDRQEVPTLIKLSDTARATTSGRTLDFLEGISGAGVEPGDLLVIKDSRARGSYVIDQVNDDRVTITEDFRRNVTNDEMDIEVRSPAPELIGPFVSNPPGTLAERLEIDVEFPGGVYRTAKKGGFRDLTIPFEFVYQRIDDDGRAVGGEIVVPLQVVGSTQTPQRRTFGVDVSAGRYRVGVRRTDPGDQEGRAADGMNWTGLKAYLRDNGARAYGPTTLIVISIAGAEELSQTSQTRISVTTRRLLEREGKLVQTSNPADVVEDVLTNREYAGRLGRTDVDLESLAVFRADQIGRSGFNGVFDSKTTLVEAANTVAGVGRARILPGVSGIRAVIDGPKPVRVGLVTPDVILANSARVGWTFLRPNDRDGVEVLYKDEDTFEDKSVLFPRSSLDPSERRIVGLTSRREALSMAEFLYRQPRMRNVSLRFQTELSGLNFDLFSRIGVALPMFDWAAGAHVLGRTGLVLRVSERVPEGRLYVQFRKQDGSVSPVVMAKGRGGRELELDEPAPVPLVFDGQSVPTLLAYSRVKDGIRDFSVTRLRPQGDRVEVECVNYDEALWRGLV